MRWEIKFIKGNQNQQINIGLICFDQLLEDQVTFSNRAIRGLKLRIVYEGLSIISWAYYIFSYLIGMQSSINLLQLFKGQQEIHQKMEEAKLINSQLDALLDYCEYSIRIEFDKNDKKKCKDKKRKQEVKQMFRKAFDSCQREEKVKYYLRVMHHIHNFSTGKVEPPKVVYAGILTGEGYMRSYNIKRWKKKLFKLDRAMHIFYAELENKIKTYQLGNYILRISKNTAYKSFVLQAINDYPHEKSRTVHIGFDNVKDYQTWYEGIKASIEYKEWEFIQKIFFSKDKSNIVFSERGSSFSMENSLMIDSSVKASSVVLDKKIDFSQFKESQRPITKTTSSDNNLNRIQTSLLSNVENPRSQIQQLNICSPDRLQKQQLEKQIKTFEQEKSTRLMNNKTIVDELIEGDNFEQPDVFQQKILEQKQESIQIKKHLDLFHKIHPEYQLSELESFQNYQSISNQGSLRLFKHSEQQKRVKMVIDFPNSTFSKQNILSIISKPQTMMKLNENIQQIQIKTFISSQNSAVMYQVNKAYNRLYRPRDFVFIRHAFSQGKKLYMVDKSVQNANYPPFMTIVRGELCIVWGVIQSQKHIQLIADVSITNEGYLNAIQELNLSIKLLKGYSSIALATTELLNYKLFDYSWDITKNESNQIQNQIRSRKITLKKIQSKYTPKQLHKDSSVQLTPQRINNISFTKKSEKTFAEGSVETSPPKQNNQIKLINPADESPAKIQNQALMQEKNKNVNPRKYSQRNMQEVGQLKEEEIKLKERLKTELQIKRILDSNGYVVISKEFAAHKYVNQPVKGTNVIYMDSVKGHPIWRGQWIHDDKEGAITFINKKKIEDQKGVLKFILTKIGKNLLSGKSILNISLPVDIFAAESNLERYIISMSYGPLLLDNLNGKDLMTKLKRVVAFGMTNSILYLNMEKPFNPILGQTFQCWLNGCPAYAEQISHHPPIGAIFFKGRGYQISAQLESKVELHMNSGCGTNDGTYRVLFDDKTQLCFITPGGQVSGLTYGDRKFNIVGKAYYWISNTNIMLELIFDPNKKGFFSVGKKQKPIDYFQGTVYETKAQFMASFLQGKRKQPSQKDRVKELGRFSGIWNKYFKFNDEQIFNVDNQYPLKLQYEKIPLPSDANWREDIQYRRLGETTRAQTQKQRLQILQRKDKKLREKYHKK